MHMVFSTRRFYVRSAASIAVATWLGAATVTAQTGATNGEWGVFGADAGATRFSPLDEIHEENVGDLEVAWRWSARDQGTPPPSGTSATSSLSMPRPVSPSGTGGQVTANKGGATSSSPWHVVPVVV